MKKLMNVAALVSLSMCLAPSADAAEKKPLMPKASRQTVVDIDSYGKKFTIERNRSAGREYATFSAEPARIDDDSVLLFEVHSTSPDGAIQRWRCIAVEDVAECLGQARRFRYVVGDKKMVLSVTAQPRNTEIGGALLAQVRVEKR